MLEYEKDIKDLIPGLINVSFDYPYQLIIPPTRYPIVLKNKKVGVIEITHKTGVIIFDKGRITADKKNKLKLSHKRKTKGEMKIKMEDSSIAYIDFDEHGKMCFPKNYTKVEVIFPINDLRGVPAVPQNADFIKNSIKKFFRRFLTCYMYGAKDFSIRITEKGEWPIQMRLKSHEFTKEEIESLKKGDSQKLLIDLMMKTKDFKIYKGYEKTQGLVSTDFFLPDYTSVKKKNCTKEQFEKSFFAMLRPFSVEPYYDFIFSAIRRSHMEDEHAIALLELATAIEESLTLYYGTIKLALGGFGIEELKRGVPKFLGKAIDSYSKLSLYDEKNKNKNTRIKLFDNLRLEFDEILKEKYTPLEDSPLFKDWIKFVWKPRHKIVHEGFREVKKEEVKKALQLTQDLIGCIMIKEEKIKKIWQLKKGGRF